MGNGYFKFRQFTVWHDRCAMKVGTDGVLLGAWADAPEVHRALDVGCGSGLIALMLAQRFPEARVTGVEIDTDAAAQAASNVQASPWAERIEVTHADFCTFQSAVPYDLIVSNPPYFMDALRPPEPGRSLARHVATLNYETLFARSRVLLASDGRVCVILPVEVEHQAVDAASRSGLYPCRKLCVFTKEHKPQRRMLIAFAASPQPILTGSLYLMNADGTYSDAYRTLTADFYLSR